MSRWAMKLFGGMFHAVGNLPDLPRYAPEKFFNLGARAEVKHPEAEKVESLLANLEGVVPALE